MTDALLSGSVCPPHRAEARREPRKPWDHRIPVEILDRIFGCLKNKAGLYDAAQHNPKLMGVCRFWYKVIANNPALWNISRDIHFGKPIKPGFGYWIRIPKTYTLETLFSITPVLPLNEDLTPQDIWEQEVSPYLEKMRTLRIQDWNRESLIIVPQLREIAARATRLTTLHLQNILNIPAYQGIKERISVQFPALQFLLLVNWVGIVPQLTCPDLRSFRMVNCDFIPSQQVWWIIQASPMLDTIELCCCTFDSHSIHPPKPGHGLQHLRDLSFNAVNCSNFEARYVEIAERLIENASSLTRLQLSIYTVHQLLYIPPAEVIGHLSELRIHISGPRVPLLAGNGIQVFREWLCHLLVPAEKLEVLAIESLDPIDLTSALSILVLGNNENNSAALCRKLRSFEIHGPRCDFPLLGMLMVERTAPLDVCQRMGYSRNIGSKFNRRDEFKLAYFPKWGEHGSNLDHVNWKKYVNSGVVPSQIIQFL